VAWSPTGPNIYAGQCCGTAADYPLAVSCASIPEFTLAQHFLHSPLTTQPLLLTSSVGLKPRRPGQNDVVTAGFLKLIPTGCNADNAVTADLIMVAQHRLSGAQSLGSRLMSIPTAPSMFGFNPGR